MLTIQRWSSFTIICLLAIAPVQAKINICHYRYQLGKKRVFARLTPAR
jgi:hypothetical protein